MAAWNKMVGIDIVDQALSHLDESERKRLMNLWLNKQAA
jgi:ABC-type antimicrobial peptide transport system ATPase subunit